MEIYEPITIRTKKSKKAKDLVDFNIPQLFGDTI